MVRSVEHGLPPKAIASGASRLPLSLERGVGARIPPRHGPLQLIVANSAWGELSNVAHRPRGSPLSLVWHTPWSELSNTAYRPRAGPLAQIVYHSEWSDVSNVAKQERIVLTAIGGAFPFLHIYEARRGHVLVRRLVDHGTGDLFMGQMAFERAAINTDRDEDRAIIDPGITMGHLRDREVAIDVYRTTDPPFPSMPSAFRFYLANTEGNDQLRRGLLRCDAIGPC